MKRRKASRWILVYLPPLPALCIKKVASALRSPGGAFSLHQGAGWQADGSLAANAVAKLLNVLMPTAVAYAITQVAPSAIFYGIAVMALIAAAVVGFFGPETTAKEIK